MSTSHVESTNFTESNVSVLNNWLRRNNLKPIELSEAESNIPTIIQKLEETITNDKFTVSLRDRNLIAFLARSTTVVGEPAPTSGLILNMLFLQSLFTILSSKWHSYLFLFDLDSLAQ